MSNHRLGSILSVDGKAVIRMEDVYDTGIDDLWSALIDPERLSRWIALVEGDLRLGGSFTADFTSGWTGPGRVDVCEAPHRLMVTLSPGLPDQTVIEAQLTAEGDKTRLVLEERGIPLDEAVAHGAGWQVHIEDLAAHLDGRPTARWRERWTDLMPLYRDAQ